MSPVLSHVTVSEEEGNCIVCLEMRADELMRPLSRCVNSAYVQDIDGLN
jgi:hypothetical protein